MKENILEYKGYHTKVEYIAENDCLYGKIEGINDLVTFEAHDLKSVKKEFHDAVDGYLAFCEEIGQEPQKEFKGLFNVRINPELHRKLSMDADKEGISMNALIERIVSEHYNPPVKKKISHQHLMENIQIPSDWGRMMSESGKQPFIVKPAIGGV
jgi:predicted HicB family RNase H-like nuclease